MDPHKPCQFFPPWVSLAPFYRSGSGETHTVLVSPSAHPVVRKRLLAPAPKTDLATWNIQSQAWRWCFFGKDRDSFWSFAEGKHISPKCMPFASPHKQLDLMGHPVSAQLRLTQSIPADWQCSDMLPKWV